MRGKRMMKRWMQAALALAVGMMLCLGMAQAQTVTGAITGTVTDQSGAVVAGAKVTAHNVDTGVNTPTTTNGTGFFRIDYLAIGRYEVVIEASGFGKSRIPAFQLEAVQTVNFNAKLTVSNSATTVNVDDAAPILNASDPTLSAT